MILKNSDAYGEDKYETQYGVGDEYIVTVVEGEIVELKEE